MSIVKNGILFSHRSGDVADRFGVMATTVQAWSRESKIPFIRIGGRYWYNLDQVEKALAKSNPVSLDDI